MQTRIQKWGNSLALRIPKSFAAESHLEQDTLVDVTMQEGRLVVTPVELAPTLDQLVLGITAENRHAEQDFGRPVGPRGLVVISDYVPERGNLVWITFTPQAGHEQAGRRPALVLSPGSYNEKAGLALVCPITNHAKGYPFEAPIPEGLTVTGVVLADHVRSVDWRARRIVFECIAPGALLKDVLQKSRTLLA